MAAEVRSGSEVAAGGEVITLALDVVAGHGHIACGGDETVVDQQDGEGTGALGDVQEGGDVEAIRGIGDEVAGVRRGVLERAPDLDRSALVRSRAEAGDGALVRRVLAG